MKRRTAGIVTINNGADESPPRVVSRSPGSPRRLVALVGPSCVGKSRLAKMVCDGKAPSLARAVGIDDPRRWLFGHANASHAIGAEAGDVLLHCELRPPTVAREPLSTDVVQLFHAVRSIALRDPLGVTPRTATEVNRPAGAPALS